VFFEASVFNQDLSKWDVSRVTTMFDMFYSSGFKRTLCGGKWQELSDGAFRALTLHRLGCCSPGTFMAQPMLNPFSKETACEDCPVGKYEPLDNDDSTCQNCGAGKYNNQVGQSDESIACKVCDPDTVSGYGSSTCAKLSEYANLSEHVDVSELRALFTNLA
jgi:surface protein